MRISSKILPHHPEFRQFFAIRKWGPFSSVSYCC